MTPRRPAPRFRPADLVRLEDRSVPAVFTATIDPAVDNTAAVAELVSFFNQANANADDSDVINLLPGAKYEFNVPVDRFDGGTALPVFEATGTRLNAALTVNGNGATFFRPAGAPSFRFLRAQGVFPRDETGAPITDTVYPLVSLTANDLTMTGANVYDLGSENRADPTQVADLSGGAVRVDQGELFLSGVTFTNNTATVDGGAVLIGKTVDKAVNATFSSRFDGTTFTDNWAGGRGGAVFHENKASPLINVFVTLTDSLLDNNKSLAGAGGLGGDTTGAFFVRSTVSNNVGDTAGGVFTSLVRMDDSRFTGNFGKNDSGAVTAVEQVLSIRTSTIDNNKSTGGGAVRGQVLEVINSTVHANAGTTTALRAEGGQAVLVFSTITNNSATSGDVAGVAVTNKNIMDIYASVLSGNRVTATTGPNQEIQADLYRNRGFNFIGVAPTDFPTRPDDRVGEPGAEIDPQLGPLADNGGPTPTRLPAAGSPLLNAAGVPLADRLVTDQRGLPRVVGGAADIGSAEAQAGEPLPVAVALPPPLIPLPPVTAPDAYLTGFGIRLSTPAPGVLANDVPASGLPLTATLVSLPAAEQGTVALAADGSFDFTPAAGFFGDATFTYAATDGLATSAPTLVTVTVGPPPPPAANPDTFTSVSGFPLVVTAPGVLANDVSPTGRPLTAALVSAPPASQGTLAFNTDGSFTFTAAAGFVGDSTFTYTVNDTLATSVPAVVTVTVPTPPPPPVPVTSPPPRVVAVGPGQAPPVVPPTVLPPLNGPLPPPSPPVSPPLAAPGEARLYRGDGSVALTSVPFGGPLPGGIRVAAGDVTGDGVDDLIAGTGPGVVTQVRVIDGATGAVVFAVQPFESTFTGGVWVAAGDVTGDGIPELVITPDEGGGPRVQMYAAKSFTPLVDFFGIADPNFRGGARAAVGDVTGDGIGDLIVAAGFGGGPRISIWDGASRAGAAFTSHPVGDFFVFDQSLRNGVFVAAGDVNGDRFADLVVGAGPGGGPRVQVLDGASVLAGSQVALADFFAGDVNSRSGVTVSAPELDNDGGTDVAAGSGNRALGYLDESLLGGVPVASLDVTPFPDFAVGVFVG